MIVTREICEQFYEQGLYGPVRILSEVECRLFVQHVDRKNDRPPLDWSKGYACSSRTFYEIGTHPTIIDVVTALLGKDVLLWGAGIINKPPGAVHAWHSDIETSNGSGKSVSVWIGLKNTNRGTSPQLVSHSHRFGVTVQQVRHESDKVRAETTREDILGWAQERNKRSRITTMEITNGDALFFDGRLWHGSQNSSSATRCALLLQYATPEMAIRIPDPNELDWPFRQINLPRPACIIVSGSDSVGVNRIVPAPVKTGNASTPQLTSRVYPLQIPLPQADWKMYPIFKGSTADIRTLSCHASVLSWGQSPHPPHIHDGEEEELLLLLSGEIDLLLPGLVPTNGDERKRMKPGDLVYYPSNFYHSLRTVSQAPANYLMIKWRNDCANNGSKLDFVHYPFAENSGPVRDGCSSQTVFDGGTYYLQKLQCHTTSLTPGAGYEPHVDSYDVAIIVLEGEVETLGERIGPYSVIFYPAGEAHGMRNPGDVIAKYIVFEFHGRPKLVTESIPGSPRPFRSKLLDSQCWIRTFKALAWHIGFRGKKKKRI